MTLHEIVTTHWQCLNEEGNQFITELAAKYLPLFNQATSLEESTNTLHSFLKEFHLFSLSEIGQEADITKEVLAEVFDYLFAVSKPFSVSYDYINDAYWLTYMQVNKIN